MPEDLTVIKQEATTVMEQAKALVVSDAESYALAGQVSSACTRMIKQFESILLPIKEREYAAYKATAAELTNLTEPVKAVRKMVDDKAYAWHDAERRRLLRAAEIEAERQAEIERAKIREREDAVLEAAEALEAFGEGQEALDILATTIPVITDQRRVDTVVKPVTPIKVAGITHKENWQFEIIGDVPVEFTKRVPDLDKIKETVKQFKGDTKIKGVRVWDAGTTIHR